MDSVLSLILIKLLGRITNADKDVPQGELLLETLTGTFTAENTREISSKIGNRLVLWSTNPTTGYTLKQYECTLSKNCLHHQLYSSTIYILLDTSSFYGLFPIFR